MSRIAPNLMASAAKGPMQGQPGSNGYWRRDIFSRSGTYTWTAKKAGKVKFQGLGAAGGAMGAYNGASGAFGEKELTVAAGDTYTIVVGSGGAGLQLSTATAGAGTTTSITGPGLASPLVLVGGTGITYNGTNGTVTTQSQGGTASGPWDKSFPGATGGSVTALGAPSSASPWGPGFTAQGYGGAGWGGTSRGAGGASSHLPGFPGSTSNRCPGVSGLTTLPSGGGYPSSTAIDRTQVADVSVRPFWDLADVDSAGPGNVNQPASGSNTVSLSSGPGAGASAGTGDAGSSSLGGGSGYASSGQAPLAGFGSGGAGVGNGGMGGTGGNAIVFVFFDEVA